MLHKKEVGKSLIFSRILPLDEEKREILVEIGRQIASSGGQKNLLTWTVPPDWRTSGNLRCMTAFGNDTWVHALLFYVRVKERGD